VRIVRDVIDLEAMDAYPTVALTTTTTTVGNEDPRGRRGAPRATPSRAAAA
jgi:hypothetical protein